MSSYAPAAAGEMVRSLLPFFFRITGQEIDTLTVTNRNWLITMDIETKDHLKFRVLQTFGERDGEKPDQEIHMWSQEDNVYLRVRTLASNAGCVFDKTSKTLCKDQLLF